MQNVKDIELIHQINYIYLQDLHKKREKIKRKTGYVL